MKARDKAAAAAAKRPALALLLIEEMTAEELILRLDAQEVPEPIREGETVEQAHRRAGRRDLVNELLANLREEKAGMITRVTAEELVREAAEEIGLLDS